MPASREKHEITKKLKPIAEHERTGLSHQKLADKYGFKDRSTVSKILRNKSEYKALSDSNQLRAGQSRMREAKYVKHDECMKVWVNQMLNFKHTQFALGDRHLQEKAMQLASLLDIEDFNASDGWLRNFKERAGLKMRVFEGKANSAPLETLPQERLKLQELLEKFTPRDTFNADEAAIYWRAPPKKGLMKGKTAGNKKEVDRVTALFCVNADGTERCKVFLIGKRACPRPFKRKTPLRHHALVSYIHGDNAWMNRDKWEDWLREFNSRMKLQKRNVLLLVDNFSGHKTKNNWIPSNVTVAYLPPNTTAHLQPLDAGIIACFKRKYSALLSRHWVNALDNLLAGQHSDETPSRDQIKLVKLVNMEMVFTWVHEAWNSISEQTFRNCWAHTGILPASWSSTVMPDLEAEVEDRTEQENEIAEILTLLKHGHVSQQYGTPLSVDEYLSIGDALDQLNMLTLEEIMDHVQEGDPEKEEGEVEEDDIAAAIKVPSEAEVLKSLVQVKIWAQYRGGEVGAQMLGSILKLQKEARRVEQINMKQTTISDFFKPATTTGLPSASSPPARSISEVIVLQDDDVEIL